MSRKRGTIRQLPSGRWQVGVMRGTVREYQTFRTKPEAEAFRKRAAAEGPRAGAGATYTTVAPEWIAWLESGMRRGYSPSTLAGYKQVLPSVLKEFPGAIRRTRQADVDAWALRLAASGLSSSTIRTRIGVLASIARHALRCDLIRALPCPFERPRVEPRSKREPVGETELEAMLELARASEDPRVTAIILLAGDAGLRRGEIAQLRRADVARDWITVVHDPASGRRTKGGRTREVPLLTDRLRDALAACALEKRLAIPDLRDQYTVSAVLEHRLGASPLHRLRHRWVSWMANVRRTPVWQLMAWAGHTSPTTTMRYYHAETLRALESSAHGAHGDSASG